MRGIVTLGLLAVTAGAVAGCSGSSGSGGHGDAGEPADGSIVGLDAAPHGEAGGDAAAQAEAGGADGSSDAHEDATGPADSGADAGPSPADGATDATATDAADAGGATDAGDATIPSESGPDEDANADAAACIGVDLQNDPANCGSCSHACGASSACSLGHCVTILATGLTAPMGLTLDPSSVYFANDGDGKIYSLPLAGGAAPTSLVTSGQAEAAWDVILVGSTLYWTTYNQQSVLEVPVTGGQATAVSTSEFVPEGIASDGVSLYWADSYVTSSMIRSAAVGGTAIVTLEPQQDDAGEDDAGPAAEQPETIAVDSSHIYWGNGGSGPLGTGSVYQAAKDGSNAIALATGLDPVTGLVIDATNVYFVTELGGTVSSVAIGGGAAAQPLATGEQDPKAIAADDTTLYWLTDSTVRKMSKTGGAVTTLATCSAGNLPTQVEFCGDFRAIAVDATYVYWTDSGTQYARGSVFRVPKN